MPTVASFSIILSSDGGCTQYIWLMGEGLKFDEFLR
jgi:hypothetical protein